MSNKDTYHRRIIEEFSPFSETYDQYVGQGIPFCNTSIKFNAVNILIDLIQKKSALKSIHTVLDLGTGTGLFAQALKSIDQSLSIVGVDLTLDMLKKAQDKKIMDAVVCADLTQDFSFATNSFDMTSISSVFEFLEGFYQHTIDEMLRVTKPNGTIAISAIKSDELTIRDYLKQHAQIIDYKDDDGYVVTKDSVSKSTPYEFILARVNPT
ncbi:MAG: class I SAM-dependent methyltransferase [Alphaproteobacteria bacterium]|nr:class I SAM-dependent methyltransferase [Alphaproteobacteria bacterium]